MERLFFEITTRKNQQWVAYQADQWRKHKNAPVYESKPVHPFITISREFGCAGFSLGEALATTLNEDHTDDENPWAVYDKMLIEKIEKDHGIHQILLESLTEKSRSEITNFFANLIDDIPLQLSVCQKLFTTIRALAHQGHVIIIGRGAAVATRGLPGGFHIRIYAPHEWKINQIMKMHDAASKKEAKALLESATQEREAFVQKIFKIPVNETTLYHVMLNHSFLSRDEMVDIIIEALKQKKLV